MNQLSLGITIALRDAFSANARAISRSFRTLDYAAFSAARSIRQSINGLELGFADVARTIAGAAALAGAIAWPIREAMDFSRALSEIETIAEHATMSMDKFRKTVMQHALAYPTDLITHTRAVYEAVSTGFLNTVDATHVAEEAIKTAVTTLTDSETALNGIVGLLNSYNLSAEYAGTVSDMLFQTIRYGKVRMRELAHNLGMVSAAAATSGLAMEELLGTYAGMTLGGLSPEQSAQYLRQLILSIVKPTKQALDVAQQYGIELSRSGMLAAGGFFPMIVDMARRTGALVRDETGEWVMGDPEQFFRLLSGRQAAAGASVLLQKRGLIAQIINDMNPELDRVYDKYGIEYTNREYAHMIRAKELDYQLDRLLTGLDIFATSVGGTTNKALAPLTKAMADWVTFNSMLLQQFPILTKLIAAFTASLAAATAAFGLVKLKEIFGTSEFKGLMQWLNTQRIPILGQLMPMNKAIMTLTGSFMLLVGASSLVHRAYERNLFGMQGRIQRFILVSRAVSTALRNMTGEWGEIPEKLARQLRQAGAWDSFVYWFKIMGRVRDFIHGFSGGLRSFFDGIQDAIIDVGLHLGKFASYFSGPMGRRIQEFFLNLRLDDTSPKYWLQLGVIVGKLVGVLGTVALSMKLFNSMVIMTKGSAWLMTRPFVFLKNLVVGPLLKGFRQLRTFMIATRLWLGMQRTLAFGGTLPQMKKGSWWQTARLQAWGMTNPRYRRLTWGGYSMLGGPQVTGWVPTLVGRTRGHILPVWNRSREIQARNQQRLINASLQLPLLYGYGAGRMRRFGARMTSVMGRALDFASDPMSHLMPLHQWFFGRYRGVRYDPETGKFIRRSKSGKRWKVVNPRDAGWLNRARYLPLDPINWAGIWDRTGGRAGRWMSQMYASGRAAAAQGVRGVATMVATGAAAMGTKAMTGLRTGAMRAVGAFKTLGLAIRGALAFLLTNPIGLAVMAGVVAITLLIKHWDKVRTALVKGWLNVRKAMARVFQWMFRRFPFLEKAWNSIKEHATSAWKTIAEAFTTYVKPVLDKFKGFLVWVGKTFFGIGEAAEAIQAPDWLPILPGMDKNAVAVLREDRNRGLQWLEENLRYRETLKDDPKFREFWDEAVGRVADIAVQLKRNYNEFVYAPNAAIQHVLQEELRRRGIKDVTIKLEEVGANSTSMMPEPYLDEWDESMQALGEAALGAADGLRSLNRTLDGHRFRTWEFPENVSNPFKEDADRFLYLLAQSRTHELRTAQLGADLLSESVDQLHKDFAAMKEEISALASRPVHVTMRLKDKVFGEAAVNANEESRRTQRERYAIQRVR